MHKDERCTDERVERVYGDVSIVLVRRSTYMYLYLGRVQVLQIQGKRGNGLRVLSESIPSTPKHSDHNTVANAMEQIKALSDAFSIEAYY